MIKKLRIFSNLEIAGMAMQVSVWEWLTLSCLPWCPWLSPCPDHSSAFLDSVRTVRTWPTDWPWSPSRSRRSTAWPHERPCPGSSSADPSPETTWSGAGFKLLNDNKNDTTVIPGAKLSKYFEWKIGRPSRFLQKNVRSTVQNTHKSTTYISLQ